MPTNVKTALITDRCFQFEDIVENPNPLAKWVKRPNDFLMNDERRYPTGSCVVRKNCWLHQSWASQMQSEVIAVLGTLGGALLVGFINYLSNRSGKNHEWRLALARDQVASRQRLYAEFLVLAQRFVVQAREGKISSLDDLTVLNGKYAEVRLVAPQSVTEVAKRLADYAITSDTTQSAKEVADCFVLEERFIVVARADIARVLSEA